MKTDSPALPPSELIINSDGSIYHLNLRPEDVGEYIITVGDPHRVSRVSRHFDRVDVRREKREFVTHTGYLGDRRVSVISTGIGPDNIDIVFNELDALVNIDFATRTIKPELTSLNIIRIGTTGGLRADLPIDGVICSAAAFGFDNLLSYYHWEADAFERAMARDWRAFVAESDLSLPVEPYQVQGSAPLLDTVGRGYARGITITAPGFYAPQGRHLRAAGKLSAATFDQLRSFSTNGLTFSNLEMETAAIYGLASLLGHRALSCSVILANRATGDFSRRAAVDTERMIDTVLARLVA